jgi:hypothetical protein
MQITEKFIIVASLIVLPLILGLKEPVKSTKLKERLIEIPLPKFEKCNADTSYTANHQTSVTKEDRDTLKMESKTWMLKQNMILGY